MRRHLNLYRRLAGCGHHHHHHSPPQREERVEVSRLFRHPCLRGFRLGDRP
jgi:hypothetical protein